MISVTGRKALLTHLTNFRFLPRSDRLQYEYKLRRFMFGRCLFSGVQLLFMTFQKLPLRCFHTTGCHY